jgi:glutamine synthetase
LSNHKTTPEALKAKISEKSLELFAELNIMNHVEVEARYEIELEEYSKKIQIEGRVLGDIARNHVVPTAIRYQNLLIENVRGLKMIFDDEYNNIGKQQIILIKEISSHIDGIASKVEAMTEARKKANKLTTAEEVAAAYCDEVKPYFDEIRYHSDKLELLVDDEMWTLTKYRELLFTR